MMNINNISNRVKISADGLDNRKAEITSLCQDLHSQLESLYEKLKITI